MIRKRKLGRRPKYPWDAWFKKAKRRSGCTIEAGKDYNCKPHGMDQQIRDEARRRELAVSVRIGDDQIRFWVVER